MTGFVMLCHQATHLSQSLQKIQAGQKLIFELPGRIELPTFCVLSKRDNPYTMEAYMMYKESDIGVILHGVESFQRFRLSATAILAKKRECLRAECAP